MTQVASLTLGAVVKGVEVKSWPSRIHEVQWVQLQSNGKRITCVACLGRGRTKGVFQIPDALGILYQCVGWSLQYKGSYSCCIQIVPRGSN
eukprot:584034-Ditylum_brightwellii.AAC.1